MGVDFFFDIVSFVYSVLTTDACVNKLDTETRVFKVFLIFTSIFY